MLPRYNLFLDCEGWKRNCGKEKSIRLLLLKLLQQATVLSPCPICKCRFTTYLHVWVLWHFSLMKLLHWPVRSLFCHELHKPVPAGHSTVDMLPYVYSPHQGSKWAASDISCSHRRLHFNGPQIQTYPLFWPVLPGSFTREQLCTCTADSGPLCKIAQQRNHLVVHLSLSVPPRL